MAKLDVRPAITQYAQYLGALVELRSLLHDSLKEAHGVANLHSFTQVQRGAKSFRNVPVDQGDFDRIIRVMAESVNVPATNAQAFYRQFHALQMSHMEFEEKARKVVREASGQPQGEVSYRRLTEVADEAQDGLRDLLEAAEVAVYSINRDLAKREVGVQRAAKQVLGDLTEWIGKLHEQGDVGAALDRNKESLGDWYVVVSKLCEAADLDSREIDRAIDKVTYANIGSDFDPALGNLHHHAQELFSEVSQALSQNEELAR
ncbi:hypothetical protein [Ferrimonas marina]|uniref:Uncharacterized protein n=1 Tax=Ferrimonas marina TaxID=299255 RepID=A0A1M5UB13_9GAMM|nr:hypothetical protein [Ferrimonas marina]SHH60184.1 hypothetical protein SAMN02745129_2484 [Ferrimonas marina]